MSRKQYNQNPAECLKSADSLIAKGLDLYWSVKPRDPEETIAWATEIVKEVLLAEVEGEQSEQVT